MRQIGLGLTLGTVFFFALTGFLIPQIVPHFLLLVLMVLLVTLFSLTILVDRMVAPLQPYIRRMEKAETETEHDRVR